MTLLMLYQKQSVLLNSSEAECLFLVKETIAKGGWLDSTSNSLEEISSLSHSVVFLYFFALITEEGFLISLGYFLELCIQMGISFLFSFAFRVSSFHSYL